MDVRDRARDATRDEVPGTMALKQDADMTGETLRSAGETLPPMSDGVVTIRSAGPDDEARDHRRTR